MENALWIFVQGHILTDHNLLMCGMTYAVIWAMEPVVRKTVERLPPAKQLVWWDRQRTWKNFAAIFWCEILIWVPFDDMRPLCTGGLTVACQTVWGRIATAAMMGIALSLGHKFVFSRVKRAFNITTKIPKEVKHIRADGNAPN